MEYILIMIRPARPNDSAAICSIYNYYVINTCASFEETEVSAAEMERRIRTISAKYPYLVWEESGKIEAYIYANTWKERSAYRYSAETSIYVRNCHTGRGLGSKLMEALLAEVSTTSLHTLVAGIVLPNEGSIVFHEKFGFQKTACFREIGFKFNKWMDIGYWELILQ